MFLEIGAGLAILALVLALTVPNLGSRWFEAIERHFGRLAKRRGRLVTVVGPSEWGFCSVATSLRDARSDVLGD